MMISAAKIDINWESDFLLALDGDGDGEIHFGRYSFPAKPINPSEADLATSSLGLQSTYVRHLVGWYNNVYTVQRN